MAHSGPSAAGDDVALTVSAARVDTPRSALLDVRETRDAGSAAPTLCGDGAGKALSSCARERGVVCGTLHAGQAGRHGVGQPAPGGRRAPRRSKVRDAPKTLPSLSSLQFESAFLRVARSFSLHPSLVTDNSCHTLVSRFCISCGIGHGGVLLWGSLLLYSRRQEGFMVRRGQVALEASA